jgi:hypothetical protein
VIFPSFLLSPRFLIGVAVVAGLAFTHYKAYRTGVTNERGVWQASVASANEEERRLERARQSRVDEAVRNSVDRQSRVLADTAGVDGELGRLRNALRTANQQREESASAAAQRASALGELLAASAQAHRELAQRCDRHVNDLRLLLDAWPK